MHRIKTGTVMLDAAQAVELYPGVVLPPDVYLGTETQTCLEAVSGDVSWTPAQYKIELTADQLTSMGAQIEPGLISMNIDVTKFVRSGLLTLV